MNKFPGIVMVSYVFEVLMFHEAIHAFIVSVLGMCLSPSSVVYTLLSDILECFGGYIRHWISLWAIM